MKDHCSAIRTVLAQGKVGETYNIGGCNEQANIEVVKMICSILDELQPRADGRSYQTQISFVADRPGHDKRYAIDASKIRHDLAWLPKETFASGLEKTIRWYLAHPDWIEHVTSGSYRDWIKQHYQNESGV